MSTITKSITGTTSTRALGITALAAAPLLWAAATAHADDVTYDPWHPGGGDVIAHIQDTTGNDSMCMYVSTPGVGPFPMFPYYSPQFWVPANANVPLDINPTIQGFRTWTVNVNCDANLSPTTVNGGPNTTWF